MTDTNTDIVPVEAGDIFYWVDETNKARAEVVHLRATIASLEAKVEFFEGAGEIANQQTRVAIQGCDERDARIASLTRERDALAEDEHALAAEVALLTDERNGSIAQCDITEAQVASLEAELEREREWYKRAATVADDSAREIERLSKHFERDAATINALRDEIEALREQLRERDALWCAAMMGTVGSRSIEAITKHFNAIRPDPPLPTSDPTP